MLLIAIVPTAVCRVNEAVAVCGVDSESATSTVNVLVAAAVGVPERIPVGLKVRPAGKVPVPRLHVYGAVPPVAAKITLYAFPTVPAGSGDVVVIATGGRLITSVAASVAVCAGLPESVAVIVNVLVPAAVGVPAMTPAVLRLRPAGKVPAVTVQVIGVVPPVAARVRL